MYRVLGPAASPAVTDACAVKQLHMEQQQQQRAMEQGLAEGYATPFQQQPQQQQRFSNKGEQQQAYISRARAASAAGASHAHAPRMWSAARDFGAAFGVGVGLYLRVLVW